VPSTKSIAPVVFYDAKLIFLYERKNRILRLIFGP